MDVVLDGMDSMFLDGVYARYAPSWERDHIYRQAVSLYAITLVGVWILYFGIATMSYHFMFDKRMMKHPRFLKNQVRKEIAMASKGFPVLDLMTLPWFIGECRGYSLMYEGVGNSPFGHGNVGGIAYIVLSSALFLWFTDLMIYLVHRFLHWPSVYKHLHKPHHKWVIPTPFSSHAFHPIDGYLQSLPYHMYVYMVPLHKYTYLGLFVVVNLWSIFIHDSDMIVGHPLENYINGPAHHTLHHMYFVYNYGQYFVWADKWGGSFRQPKAEDDPLLVVLKREEAAKMYKEEKEAMRQLAEETVEDELEIDENTIALNLHNQGKAVQPMAASMQVQTPTITISKVQTQRHSSSSPSPSTSTSPSSEDGSDDSGVEVETESASASEPEEAVTPSVEEHKRELRRRRK